MKNAEESIKDIEDEIAFKEKRCCQLEAVRDYGECANVTEEIRLLKGKRQLLQNELSLLKQSQAKWYKSKRKPKKSSTTSISDDSDHFSTPSPASLTCSSTLSSNSASCADLVVEFDTDNLHDSQPAITFKSNQQQHHLESGLPQQQM